MPTKKKRVGFIPRNEVLNIINNLSYENNLSYSKIISILVEEALRERGLLDVMKGNIAEYNNIKNKEYFKDKENFGEVNKKFDNNFKNKVLKDKNLNFKEEREEPFDNEIYSKFIMFLKFQEKMKKIDK